MKLPTRLTVIGCTLLALTLGGCAAGHVKTSDRDTTGTYDGVWVGTVGSPSARRVSLPGNWYMNCDWEPFEVYFVVEDGRMQIGKLEGKTPVSSSGRFRMDIAHGDSQMIGGIMSGNGKYVTIFSGKFSGDATGKYQQVNTSIGTYGCTSKMQFHRYDETST